MQFLFSFKRPGVFMLIFFSILFVLPFLAPILSSFGANSISRIIYFIYSWFCHQFHTRSLYLFDHQCAWCARDTGIWAGVLLSSWLYLKGFVERIRWFHLPIFVLPILLDGGVQTISSLISLNQAVENSGEYLSNNFLRFVTGAWLGIGIGLWIVPNISEVIGFKKRRRAPEYYQAEMQKPKDGNLGEDASPIPFGLQFKNFSFITILTILILFYIFLVFLWNLTSQVIKPTNFIDSIPKDQDITQFERRKYGECPSKGNNIFNFECFIYGTEAKF